MISTAEPEQLLEDLKHARDEKMALNLVGVKCLRISDNRGGGTLMSNTEVSKTVSELLAGETLQWLFSTFETQKTKIPSCVMTLFVLRVSPAVDTVICIYFASCYVKSAIRGG